MDLNVLIRTNCCYLHAGQAYLLHNFPFLREAFFFSLRKISGGNTPALYTKVPGFGPWHLKEGLEDISELTDGHHQSMQLMMS